MADDEKIPPEMWKGWLERDGYVQVRNGADADLLLKSLEHELMNGTIVGATVNYRAEEWVVIFDKKFYDAHCDDASALNPLLRRALEKVHDYFIFGKAVGEGGKKAIRLPGTDRPLGEFAEEIAEYYSMHKKLFFRPETSDVVRIGMVKIDDSGHKILGLQPVNSDAFVTFLENDTYLFTLDGRGGRHIHSVQAQTAKLVLSSVDQFRMKLPIIRRILPVPIPRLVNGELKFPRKGYDSEFMSFVPEDAPHIKEMPIEDAKELLLNEVYGEFAFKSPQDRVNAIAHLLTPFCRGLFSRETIRSPLFMYIANREGAGKDFAGGIVTITHEGEAGEDPPVTKAESGSDEEFRKKVVASFKIGRNLLHSSNNKGYLNSSELEALVTKEVYVDRLLGSNTLLEFPNTLTISLSANTGLTYPPDLQRRGVFINLFLDVEDPNSRIFKNPDLHGWVKAHRSEVLSALYALVHNWVEKGMPKSRQPFASFPEWQAVVGGILEAANLGTPLQNDILNSIGGDEETNSMRQLYAAAYEAWGQEWVPKAKIFSELQNPDSTFFGLFAHLDWERHPESAKMRMGKLLSKYAGRIFSDIRLEELKSAGHHSNRSQYRFVKVGASVQSQSALQNNETEDSNKSDTLGTLGTLETFTLPKNIKNDNIHNIAIEKSPPISPISPSVAQTHPDSNTSLENSALGPANPPFQENGNSQLNASVQTERSAKTVLQPTSIPSATHSPASGQDAGVPSPAPGSIDRLATINQVLVAVKLTQELDINLDPEAPDPRLNAALANLYSDEIRDVLHELERSGDIYEVRPGFWRVVHADDE